MKLFNIIVITLFASFLFSCSDDEGKYIQADPDAKYYVEKKEVKVNLSASFITVDDNIYAEIHLSSGAIHKFSFTGNTQGNITDKFINAELSDFSIAGDIYEIKSGKISFDKEFGLGGLKFEDVIFRIVNSSNESQEVRVSGYAYLNKK